MARWTKYQCDWCDTERANPESDGEDWYSVGESPDDGSMEFMGVDKGPWNRIICEECFNGFRRAIKRIDDAARAKRQEIETRERNRQEGFDRSEKLSEKLRWKETL